MTDNVQVFHGEWDDEGVFFYQAYNNNIADWAIEHQQFGGPEFNPRRMTWIKPSFAWVLYRSGYGHKHGQKRILKIKLPHNIVADLLSQCKCKHSGGGSNGRVQWDPARDIMTTENGKEPRCCQRMRAIQIGLKGPLSEQYVQNVISIQDVTNIAHSIGEAHCLFAAKGKKIQTKIKDVNDAMEKLMIELPVEESYIPHCSEDVLIQLGMLPGTTSNWVSAMGRGGTERMEQIVLHRP